MKQKKTQKKIKDIKKQSLKKYSFTKKMKKKESKYFAPFFMRETENSDFPTKIQDNLVNNKDILNTTRSINEYVNSGDDYIDDYDEDKCGIEKVQIFGTDGKNIIPILTDAEGRLKISADIIVVPISYKEIAIKNIPTTNDFQYTHSYDVSKNMNTSFIIFNHSLINSVTIQLQDSPDNNGYQLDLPEMIVEPKSFKIFTPTRFIRYQRIAYRSTNLNNSAEIDIFYQAQSYITS